MRTKQLAAFSAVIIGSLVAAICSIAIAFGKASISGYVIEGTEPTVDVSQWRHTFTLEELERARQHMESLARQPIKWDAQTRATHLRSQQRATLHLTWIPWFVLALAVPLSPWALVPLAMLPPLGMVALGVAPLAFAAVAFGALALGVAFRHLWALWSRKEPRGA